MEGLAFVVVPILLAIASLLIGLAYLIWVGPVQLVRRCFGRRG